MIGAHQSAEQQHGSQFHTDQIRAKQGQAHFPRFHILDGMGLDGRSGEQIHDFGDEHRGKNLRANPHARGQPLAFHLHGALPQVEHHDYKDEQHHDGPGVDDDLQRGYEGGAQDVENDGD